ncbi:MAG: ATP-binding protein [Alloprevotella sp.]
MKFFDREKEIAALREVGRKSLETAQFTVVTGRRRIGKTSLVWKAFEGQTLLYFFVARKSEADLCEDFRQETEQKLGLNVPERVRSFSALFDFLMQLSAERPLTLFIDEFQDFYRVNNSIYSDMQRIWDIRSPHARINLIVCGSIFSMMTKIFRDKKEPLYNRQTRMMTVRPFAPSVLKEILGTYNPNYEPDDLLALFSFTGGVAKYVQLLMDAGATTKDKMIDHIIQADSIFLNEGKAVLIEEFGKDYGIYFSILSAIARGKTLRAEIEKTVGKEIGGYLTKLEKEYEVIGRKQPLLQKTAGKNIRYVIEDNFFTFWFRFIFKYGYVLEIENYPVLRSIIQRDYETFSGLMLERWHRRVLIEQQRFTRIGGWWDRKGENEIDIVAENELDGVATFFEVKRKAENIDLPLLQAKADAFLRATGAFKNYALRLEGLSLANM